jgi:hypothetical protein
MFFLGEFLNSMLVGLEAEQHIAQLSVGHIRNKEGNQKVPGI